MPIPSKNQHTVPGSVLTPVIDPNQIFFGTAADDNFVGGSGSDTFIDYAGAGQSYNAPNGNDRMSGGAGKDTFYAGPGNNVIDGGSGIDTVDYIYSDYANRSVALDLQSGQAISRGIDTLISIENAMGTRGNDLLFGSTVANHLVGRDGSDRLDGRGGKDTLDGGRDGDRLSGGADDDVLNGQEGDDALYGGTGHDVLWGGKGWDTLSGGAGKDRFVFDRFDGDSFDTITDFRHGRDKIDVRSIDARTDKAGDQAFTFDSTPDGSTEEFFDSLSGDWNVTTINHPGPNIDAERGEIEFRHSGAYTYVYLGRGDGPTAATFRIEGHVDLSASDFLL